MGSAFRCPKAHARCRVTEERTSPDVSILRLQHRGRNLGLPTFQGGWEAEGRSVLNELIGVVSQSISDDSRELFLLRRISLRRSYSMTEKFKTSQS
jgi:hypothetical protein